MIIIVILVLLGISPAFGQMLNPTRTTQLAGSGTFTVPNNVYLLRTTMCGGGGGGGGVAAAVGSAAGGTSGEWVNFTLTTNPGAPLTYSVGAGGAGGAAGNNVGLDGSTTNFAGVNVFGGVGGTGSAGGSALAWTQNAVHAKRHLYVTTNTKGFVHSGIAVNGPGQAAVGGSGGDPGNGVGLGGAGVTNADGPPGAGFCSGGAGANNQAGTTARAGGNGAAGTIVLTY